MAASLAPSLFAGDFVLLIHKQPKFGDLARCADPEAPGRFVIGRIVGEPGSQLQLSGNEVIVDGKTTHQETVCLKKLVDSENPTSGAIEQLYCTVEALGNTKHLRGTKVGVIPPWKRKFSISDKNVFLVSDNRVYPLDSRYYGAVPWATCTDIVFFRIKSKKGWNDVDSRLSFIQ
jgi:signal peptidase I